jgi:hypothetical protein
VSTEFATQLTAVATLALAVLALATAVLALLAWRKQSKEVSDQAKMLGMQLRQLNLQRQQLKAQREDSAREAEALALQVRNLRREADERRSGQAAHVFLTLKRHPPIPGSQVMAQITATVTNNGRQPMYEGWLRWHLATDPFGDPNPEPVGTIMPGGEVTKARSFPQEADLGLCGALLEFRDAAAVKWMRLPDGYLHEMP